MNTINNDKSLKFSDDHPNHILIDKRSFLMNNASYYFACKALGAIEDEDSLAVANSIANIAREEIQKMSDAQVETAINKLVTNCDSSPYGLIAVDPNSPA